MNSSVAQTPLKTCSAEETQENSAAAPLTAGQMLRAHLSEALVPEKFHDRAIDALMSPCPACSRPFIAHVAGEGCMEVAR